MNTRCLLYVTILLSIICNSIAFHPAISSIRTNRGLNSCRVHEGKIGKEHHRGDESMRGRHTKMVAKPNKEWPNTKNIQRLSLAALIATASLTFSNVDVSMAALPSSSSVLEDVVQKLEKSQTRQEVLQSMADLYEIAGTKTLLTRTKYKSRIINAINEKHVNLAGEWDQAVSYASGELKRRSDPFRTVDLKGYLQVAPFIGAGLYLGTLFVQQSLPELFSFAYPAAVFVFVAPILFIVLTT